ncbi:MAG TPA: FHA domain-containing protein [Kofleriaceae bacterium]|nr:FHA domain-containing protein [Kofleriaceae bacterium]
MTTVTTTDRCAKEWQIDDQVVQLREWGTEIVHVLPKAPCHRLTIGSAERCMLRLVDPSGSCAEEHAQLERNRQRWIVRDLHSTYGTWIDGARRNEAWLEPGSELGIGSLTLVAESRRLVELRRFMARLLGWGPGGLLAVDRALRTIRLAAARRVPLVLCGRDDLTVVARAIHQRVLGEGRPFVVCDPRRQEAEANVRTAGNSETGIAAMQRALGGSLCVWRHRLPDDFEELRRGLRDPASRVQLIVCSEPRRQLRPSKLDLIEPISIPSLKEREHEIGRIVDECAEEAAAALFTTITLTPADRRWILRHSASSVCEIEKGTRRLLAILEHGGSLAGAARLLGMASVSLHRWFERRSGAPCRPGRSASDVPASPAPMALSGDRPGDLQGRTAAPADLRSTAE